MNSATAHGITGGVDLPSAGLVAAAKVRAASGIGFEGITVSYKGSLALADFTLAVRPGEILALIGPSGSGKTTALRVVAGFVRPLAGRVSVGGRDVTDLPPHARGIGMVVQNYALFPHMRVAGNVAFGLRARRAAKAQVRAEVESCLAMVGMADFAQRYPRELSGGQQQRVAIARALAIRPDVLLLDEPLSALDAQIRLAMLEELARLHRSLPALTVLYVTHDQAEALTLAERIGILRGGRLLALGPSRALYRRPPNRFAAEFLGGANLLPVVVETPDAGCGVSEVRFGAARLRAFCPERTAAGERRLLCIRPHDLSFAPPDSRGDPGANSVPARVREVRWKGELNELALEAEGHRLRLVSASLRALPEPGTLVSLNFTPEDASLLADEGDG